MNQNTKNTYLILHNIRSAHNVGAIFRTADAAGASAIFLTGYTPVPIDRFGIPQKEIAKTALGAERCVPWESYTRIGYLIKKLKKEKRRIVCLEQAAGAVDYKNMQGTQPLALIVGNEIRGVSAQIMRMCDEIVEIPMHGKKESLNVSAATAIALFQIRDGCS